VNFCSDITVGSGAGDSRKLLKMDSSVGAMMDDVFSLRSVLQSGIVEVSE
jgi:hypothetical protein